MIPTTSLATSKLLKEKGFNQETYFYWNDHQYVGHGWVLRDIDYNCSVKQLATRIAAPTTDELLAELPKKIRKDTGSLSGVNKEADWYLQIHFSKVKYQIWYAWYFHELMDFIQKDGASLPEALAQMWLHLKEEKLI